MTEQGLLVLATGVLLGAGTLLAFGRRGRTCDLPERMIVAFLPALAVLVAALSLDFVLTSRVSIEGT